MDNELTRDEIIKHMGDPWWRLNNLYYIRDENGNKVLFKPEERYSQKFLFENLWFFTIVPKARQLGITTFFTILYLDQILFSKNKTAGIVAHKQDDMKKIFRNKIKFAWDNLHPWLKSYIGEPDSNNANELIWKDNEGNTSSIFVSMSTRSGTVQYLHISEFGYVCQKFPEKAEEIVTGAINSVHEGNMVSIESTAAGQEGYFYEFCMDAEQARKEGRELTKLDFKIFFFPWWVEEHYRLKGHVLIPKDLQDYFQNLKDKHNIVLDTEQQNWYTKKKALQGDKMFQEYPSTLEECFQASIEGSYYQTQMAKVYLEKRIKALSYDPNKEVDTWWDLGMNDFTVVLLTQNIGDKINFIDMYWSRGEPLSHYYDWLKTRKEEMGYRYGYHNFPHDIETRELQSGISRKQTLWNLGLRNMRVGTKVGIQDGIERVRQLFPKFQFDEIRCKKLHEALFNYRKEFDDKLGVFRDKPRHDDNSHFADPVRLLGELWRDVTPLLEEDAQKQTDQSFFS